MKSSLFNIFSECKRVLTVAEIYISHVELKTQIETFKRIAVWKIDILLAIFCAVLKSFW